jgi:TatD DNase family protein
MPYIDVHCHLTDPRLDGLTDQLIQRSQSWGVDQWLLGGVGPEDWKQQIKLAQKYPQQVWTCLGLHPYFVAENPLEVCEQALDQLAPLILNPQNLAIGEMGLDFRTEIEKDSRNRQIEIFQNQLELAIATDKPVVLHLVQCHEEALKVLDLSADESLRGMVHAFNGTWQKADDFLQRGLALSVGGAVTKNPQLRACLEKVPLERLLIESDTPDQKPRYLKSYNHLSPQNNSFYQKLSEQNQEWEWNEPSSIWEVARVVGEIHHKEAEEILKISAQNFKHIFLS